jgi:hypothetical protein
LAGGEGGGVPARLLGEVGVADGIDAAVHAMESTARNPASDLTVHEPRAKELNEGYLAVLALRYCRDHRIRGGGVAADLLY